MLAEFALTPSVFDESVQPDLDSWRDQLRELGSTMFPRTGAWPVMISNLYAGSWEQTALKVVKGIKDAKARSLCEGLLTNAAKTMVFRPALGEWPDDDPAKWGREAIESHAGEPIDRILTCKPAHTILVQECRFIRCIDEVHDSGFWKGVSSTWSPSMSINDQVQTLRKLCVHSQFLCLVTPHIRGTMDDETEFLLSMIKSAMSRATDYLPAEIEIHTEAPDNQASADFAARLASVTRNITLTIKGRLGRGNQVKLVVWPKLLDRYLVAGVYTKMADGTRKRSPRWGVSMQHIARKSDERSTRPPTSWSLLNSGQLYDQFGRYCSDASTGFLHSEMIVG